MFDAAAAATAAEVNQEQVAQEQAEAAVSSHVEGDGPTADHRESHDLLQAIATYHPGESTTEIVFVDPTVPNYEALMAGIEPHVEVIMLDATRDGMEQIAESLAGRSDIDAIHLISHGSSGELQLGTGTLTAESMSGEYANEMATIRESLSDQADFLVYGCNFGDGSEGVEAVNLLAEITGADVAASSDRTGHIDLGGDWEFEVQVGSIETDLALTDTTQMNWAGILGTETVRDEFSTRSYGNNDGTQRWASTWSETDADGGGATGGDIRMKSGQLRIDTDAVGNAVGRSVDLSGATSATLTFTYRNTLSGADRIEARASNDGGATYTTLAGGVFSDSSNTGTGSLSLDISEYASSNTRIQFIVMAVERGGGDRLSVDNVQVSYNTGAANSAPTVSSQGGGTTASVTVAEHETAVTTVTAVDVDAGQSLTYSVAGGADAAQFTIDSRSGELRFASAPNYEAPTDSGGNNVYDVTVQVSDGNGGTDTQAIAVTVANTNETPTDLALSANTVAEHAATGTVVGTVSGTDPDSGDMKTYSLIDTAGGRFAINRSTGEITVADGSLLDYESAMSHTVTVRVTDAGGLTYDETFTINLTNVNEAPTITSNGGGATASLNVAEHETRVTTVAAVDVDAGTPLTYSIAGGPDAARFVIDGVTGEFRFSAAPNFERPSDVGRNNVYNVTVQVADGQGGTTTQSISVRVTDVNEAPRITSNRGGDVASVTIRENSAAVTTVRATDPDRGARITYSVVGGTDAALFTINPSTGVLRFSSAPNFEQPSDTDRNNVYQVVVQASDGRGGTDSQVISVRVTNINEAPTDLSLSANRVAEHAAAGTVIGTVTSRDPDTRDTKTYSLTDSAGGRFAIHRSTGVMTVADGNLLDYESATSHRVTVRVTDRGGQSYEEAVTINLTNVNDAPTGADATITITEDTVHSLTTANFGFSDLDAGDSLSAVRIETLPSAGTLTLSGAAVTAGQVISVADMTAGHLVFTPAADANGTDYVSVTFSVQDNHGAYDVGPNTLTFNVTATDDAPVNHVPGSQTVAVDTPLAITGLSVTDVDGNLTSVQLSVNNGTLALTLSGSATVTGGAIGSSTLTISGSQADLNTTLASLIYQGASLYTGPDTLTVLSTETGGLTDTDTMGITVSNNAPTNSLPASQTVAEDTPLAISGISVVDADGNLTMVELSVSHGTLGVTLSVGATISAGSNGSDSLTLSGTQAALNATLASVTYQGNLNFSGLDTLTITSTDSTGTSDMDNLSITVTSVNDAPTAISVMPTTVAETVANGTIVGTASTTDPDEGDTHTYQLLDSAGGRFAINSSTGVITVADGTLLDYEAATSHTITVRTTDAGGLVHDQSFIINLTDVNETPTDLILSANTVAENAANGTVIGTVSGTDPDSGDTKAYSFTDSAGGRFAINSATGQITVANGSLLNYESATSHSVTVRVTDAGGLTYDETFTINLTDVNETPTAVGLSGNAVAENATNGTVVGTASTTDPDAGDTHTYSLTDSASGRFAIDTNTGQITVADGSLLDYETATSHTIMVRTTDAGGLTYDQIFTINLTNVNEAPTGVDGSITINEDTSHALTTANFGFSDVDAGDSLSAVRIDSLPGVGTLTLSGVNVTAGQVIAVSEITAGNLVFTPTVDATGIGYASFTFSVRDSNNAYDPAPNTLTFDVMAVNDAPVNTVPGAQTVAEDTPLSISGLSVNDVDGNLSTVQLGVVNGTVSVTLQGGATISAGSNGTNSLTLSGSQADINATLATLVYQGTPSFNGADTLTVTSMDSGSDVDTVAITVTAVNDATVVTGGTSGTGAEDTTLTGTLTATDNDGLSDGTVFTVTTTATNGTASINPETGQWTYTPNPDYNGADSFTATLTDDAGNSSTQVSSVSVTAVNDAPVLAINTGSTAAEGGTDTIDSSELAVTDVDNSAAQLTYTIGTGPLYGRLELTTAPGITATTFTQADIAAGRLVYIHDGSETTSDSFTFTVNDGAGGGIGATTMTLTITPVNNAPTITSDGGASTASINVAENVSAITIVTGADVDLPAQALTYSISGGVDQARFTINTVTGSLNFVAPANFEAATDANGNNVYVVQVQVTDSQGANTIQTIHVTVTDMVEHAPSTPPTIPPVLLSQPPVPPGPGTPPTASPPTLDHGPGPGPSGPPVKLHPISQEPLTLVLPPDRPVAWVPEEPRKPTDDVKETPLFLVNDDQRRPLFTVLPVEPTAILEPEPPETKQTVSDLLMAKLDEMTVSLEQAMSVSQEQREIVARVAAVTGITLSAGFITWALRSGTLLASCLATMPAWRHFDPLPVVRLSRAERTRRREEMARAGQQEATEFSGLKRVLDDKPTLKRTA
jgi:hypothetical protein